MFYNGMEQLYRGVWKVLGLVTTLTCLAGPTLSQESALTCQAGPTLSEESALTCQAGPTLSQESALTCQAGPTLSQDISTVYEQCTAKKRTLLACITQNYMGLLGRNVFKFEHCKLVIFF